VDRPARPIDPDVPPVRDCIRDRPDGIGRRRLGVTCDRGAEIGDTGEREKSEACC